MAEALATLTRSNDRNQQKQPADLAFLALAQHRLGQFDQAAYHPGSAARVDEGPAAGRESGVAGIPGEAETIELDRVFPADLFAH